jgi:hypothetical protein
MWVTLWSGRKPTKRTPKAFGAVLPLHGMGSDDEELFDHIAKLKQADNTQKNI